MLIQEGLEKEKKSKNPSSTLVPLDSDFKM